MARSLAVLLLLHFCVDALYGAMGGLLPRVTAAPTDHQITQLPGWKGKLPSKAYAGYIDAGTDTQGDITYKMHEHYMFIEAEHNPEQAPVLLWSNGGPGASSFFGLFVELGPFMLDDASLATAEFNETGVPTLWYNQYGWTQAANLLIINSPPPVGYSYCDPAGPAGNGSSCGAWNDTRTATHNYEFLVNWFDAFPEYKERELYLSGESYAGIYIPTLAREIVRHQDKNPIKLAGFAMGDAVLGRGDVAGGSLFGIEFMHGHAQFSDRTFEQIMSLCHPHQLEGSMPIPPDGNCSQAQAAMSKEIGGYYMYNLYDDCWYENDLMRAANAKKLRNFHTNINEQSYFGPPPLTGASADEGFATGRMHRSKSGQDGFTGGLNDYPCGGPHALNVWVNASAVRKALHVTADAFFFSGDNGVGFPYHGDEGPLIPFYKELQSVASSAPGKVRVLIYSGDVDPCINTFWSQNWTSHVGFEEIAPWRPWTLDGKQRMGGYVTRYANDFDFLTIRGSGHMVPEFKPAATLEWLTKWLHAEDWLPYTAPA